MKRNKKLITLVLLALLCLGLAVTGSLAAFTKTNYIKRVVSTKPGNSELRFSSNYLLPLVASNFETRQIHLGETLSLSVTVCNYPQSDMTRYSSSNITFKLNVALLNADGTALSDETARSKLKINNTVLSSYTPTDITLNGGQPSMKQFTFSYAGDNIAELKNYRLRVQAVPDSSSGVSTLAADFLFSDAQPADISWTGSFYPNDIQKKTLSTQMDAFTYEIHGSAVGRLKLEFSNDLEIGQYSYAQLTKPSTSLSDGKTIIEFDVGGKDQPTSYLLQFYRKVAIPADETWTTVNGYISQPELITDSTS